jgi:hypothetical protein
MMDIFMVGGEERMARRWVERVKTLGYRFNMVGHADWDKNPRLIDLPDGVETTVVLKDSISHKIRDKVRDIARSKGVRFIETSRKVSVAAADLRLILDNAEMEEPSPMAEIFPSLLERMRSEVEEKFQLGKPNVGFLPPETVLFTFISHPWDARRAATSAKLFKWWFHRLIEGENYPKEVKKMANPFPLISATFKAWYKAGGEQKSFILNHARNWLLSAEDEGYTFKGKGEIDRALRMIFGARASDLTTEQDCDLIASILPQAERKVKKPSVDLPVEEEPEVEEALPVEEPEASPVVEEALPVEEPLPEVEPEEKGLWIKGVKVDFTGALTLPVIDNLSDITLIGYSVSVGELKDGRMLSVRIEDK